MQARPEAENPWSALARMTNNRLSTTLRVATVVTAILCAYLAQHPGNSLQSPAWVVVVTVAAIALGTCVVKPSARTQ